MTMRIFLAPMEGVVDPTVRHLLTAIGGIDICVTEFVRVTDHTLPDKVFNRYCPELAYNSRTAANTPVRIQLLGGKAEPMAANGQKAAQLGASAIDINFGCPAKTVNKNDGGACLLQSPNRLYDIVSAVRKAVPEHTPVTAKMRLGFAARGGYLDRAQAIYEAGANELVVHARSKVDGYKPPAYWETIGDIREQLPIPVIANGEIWSIDDFQRCKAASGCEDIMLGRGLMACPDLGLQIKAQRETLAYQPLGWPAICALLLHYFLATEAQYPKKYLGNRLKQWLVYLRRHYPQAQSLFDTLKRHRDRSTIINTLKQHTNLAAVAQMEQTLTLTPAMSRYSDHSLSA